MEIEVHKGSTIQNELAIEDSHHVAASLRRIFKHPMGTALLGTTGLIGIAVTSVYLTPLLWDITHTCFDAEMKTQADFNACNKTFVPSLILTHSLLALFSAALGAAVQRSWELPLEGSGTKLEKFVAYLQKNYCFEGLLLLGYLYNGIGIKVTNPATFHDFLVCTAASVGIGASILGMYARSQWIGLKKIHSFSYARMDSDIKSFLKRNWKILSAATIASGMILLTSLTKISFLGSSQKILRDLSIVVLSWPIGQVLHFITENRENCSPKVNKIKKIFHTAFHCNNLMVFGGYSSYFSFAHPASKYIGLFLIGLAQGLHTAQEERREENSTIPLSNVPSNEAFGFHKYAIKTLGFVKEYWKTAALVAFSIALARIQFLNCDGPPTPLNFTCPIGLETSVYVAGNQIIIDSFGANIALITGLAHYYLRKLSKTLGSCPSTKNFGFYAALFDKCQYILLTMIPYSVIHSGHYVAADDDFYSLNPLAPLLLLGLTFGTHKEQKNNS